MKKQNKQYLVFAGILAALLLPPVIAFAIVYNSTQRRNSFSPAEAEIEIVESNESGTELTKEYTIENNNGTYSVEKPAAVYDVRGKNDEYLRVQFIPMWYDSDGFVCGSVTEYKAIVQEGNKLVCKDENNTPLITLHLADNWSNSWTYNLADGCFYYNGLISADKTTPELLKKVEISSAVYDDVKDDYTLRIDVLADAVQRSADAKGNREWN